jgi:alpha-galactosidase
MRKIVFIGAGSFIFTRNLVRDVLTFPAFRDCHIALVDTDPQKLDFARRSVNRIADEGGYPATVAATTDRAEVLAGADAVIVTISLTGSRERWSDLQIPLRYGVDINVGDTRGPAGIFRMLRTLPAMLQICRDIERLCPDAVVLNYTNPMSTLCRAMQEVFPELKIVGLCHSVQGVAGMLARWIGAPLDEVTYLCAGINHQAWYLEYKWNGRDAYPLIREAVAKPENYNHEQVQCEMFLHLGYFVTESSGHNSEYCAWFRKRPDLIERYCTHGTGWNPGLHAMGWKGPSPDDVERVARRIECEIQRPVSLARGEEYASYILDAVIGSGEPFVFNGNVRNWSLIDNLPDGACVEVPVFASRRGFDPVYVGPLPPQLAILNSVNAQCDEMAVRGALDGDPTAIFHAIAYDPLTSAVCSLSEIKDMVGDLFRANADCVTGFKPL